MLEAIRDFDTSLLLALNGSWGPFWDQFFWHMSAVKTWAPLYAAIIFVIWTKYGWKYTSAAVVCMILMVVAVDQVANIFKYGVQKLRPTHNPALEGLVHIVNGYVGGLYGTVSAHAATCFSIAVFSSVLVRSRLYTVLILFWAALVSYSRIYLGAHFPLDILFGMITGILGAVLFLWLFRLIALRMRISPDNR